MKRFYSELLWSGTGAVVLVYFVFSFLISFIDTNFISTDELYILYNQQVNAEKYDDYNDYVSDFEEDLADLDLEESDAIDWEGALWDLIFIGVEFLISIIVVSAILFGAVSIYFNHQELEFGQILKPITLASFLLQIPVILSLIWFGLIQTDFEYQDLLDFKPLYPSSAFDNDELSGTATRFLDILNPYLIGFVLVAAKGMHILNVSSSYKKLLSLTAISIVTLLICWNVLVTYLIAVLT